MSDNKLVKAVMDGAVLAAVITGIGWVGKKVLKENFISDPSTSFTNYFEFSRLQRAQSLSKLSRRSKNHSF